MSTRFYYIKLGFFYKQAETNVHRDTRFNVLRATLMGVVFTFILRNRPSQHPEDLSVCPDTCINVSLIHASQILSHEFECQYFFLSLGVQILAQSLVALTPF